MRNLIKISLITSIVLSSNLFAWTEAETETRVNANLTELNNKQLQIDDLDEYKLDKTEFYPTRDLAIQNQSRLNDKDIVDNQQTSDIVELFSRTDANQSNYTTLQDQVNNIESQSYATEEYVDEEIENIDDEIYGWIDSSTTSTNSQGQTIITERESEDTIYATLNGQTQTVFNTDTGELISETTIKKGLIELSDENVVKDNQQDIDIANNNTLANSAFTNANTAVNQSNNNGSEITLIKNINDTQNTKIDNNTAKNTAQDIVINQAINDINIEKTRNDNQDTQISNLTSLKADKSEVVLVNNRVDNNESRLDQKDIKDSQQDTQINSNTNRITTVEHNVSTLVSNSNNQVNNRLDNQDRRISSLEKELAKTDKRENKKIASGMATNLNFDFTNGDRSFAFNHSNFNGENALGVGYAYRKNGTTISISLGTDFENVGVKTQASFSF